MPKPSKAPGPTPISRLRRHLPEVGLGGVACLLVLELVFLRDWDVGLPSHLKGQWGPYLLALVVVTLAPGLFYGFFIYYLRLFACGGIFL